MITDTPFVPLAGGCNCGAVRFHLEVAPIITHCCHCRQCQKTSGAAFRVNAMIETEHVTVLTGTPRRFHGVASHAVWQCTVCGYALWSHHPHLGDGIAFVGVGVLDHGELLPPEAHYFTRSKHPWVTLPTGVPIFEERGDPGKAGARERIGAVLAKRGTAAGMDAYASGAPSAR